MWWSKADLTCYNGKAVNITFKLAITVPTTDIIFGIAYNTTTAGYAPYGTQPCNGSSGGCGYDSLNVAVSQDGGPNNNVTIGTDPNPNTVFWNTATPSNYCDGGAAGSGTFRLDSPSGGCWSVNNDNAAPFYVPAVQFSRM